MIKGWIMDGAEQTMPDLLTPAETIAYLGLDREGTHDPVERLRNLIRRQGLPVMKRGKFQRFRRSDVDAWLAGERVGRRIPNPVRKVGR